MPRLSAIAAALLLGLAATASAEEGPLAGSYYQGYFGDGSADNDWFFDRYGAPLPGWPDGGGWYRGQELFSGHYDDGRPGNDWFFDAYGEPGDAGLFDV